MQGSVKDQKVLRTRNNPVSDYGEWLVAEKLGLKLEPSNTKGYDATGTDGLRYQIKARRLERPNSSRQLGIIRNLDGNDFDYLVGILFDNSFGIIEAYLIPHDAISKFGKYSRLQNGHILQLKGRLLDSPGVKSVSGILTNNAKDRLP